MGVVLALHGSTLPWARSASKGVRRYSVGDACIIVWVSDNKQGVRMVGGVETLNASIF